MEGRHILLYIPNIIGYFRILLTAAAFVVYDRPLLFVILYGTNVLLDGLDGFAARKLNQCTIFGAWFDVVVDLLGRGLLWCSLHQLGYLVMFVEWLTFVGTHSLGSNWKMTQSDFPWLVSKVMANGFKTVWGAVAIGGLHFLPLGLYAYTFGFLTDYLFMPAWSQAVCVTSLSIGRLICMYVEVFYIYHHVSSLLNQDVNKQTT